MDQKRPGSDLPLIDKLSEEELESFRPEEDEIEDQDLALEEVTGAALQLYKSAISYVLESIRRAQEGKRPDLGRGEELAKNMRGSMEQSSSLLLLATNRRQPFTVSTHSVNVTVIALRIAQSLKYEVKKQIQVGVAALLHEIGVGWLPNRLLHESGPVAAEVKQKVRERAVYSAQILERLCPECDWLAQTVGQVYEREDGSGFPQGLKGSAIREEAKILGIADVFEACIHDRPYRKALTGYQLIHELTRGKSGSFAEGIVKALVRSFSVYPYNEYVVLNTNEVGKVVEVNSKNLMRPVVRILYSSSGEPLEKPREIDLAQNPSLSISEAITYDRLPARPA